MFRSVTIFRVYFYSRNLFWNWALFLELQWLPYGFPFGCGYNNKYELNAVPILRLCKDFEAQKRLQKKILSPYTYRTEGSEMTTTFFSLFFSAHIAKTCHQTLPFRFIFGTIGFSYIFNYFFFWTKKKCDKQNTQTKCKQRNVERLFHNFECGHSVGNVIIIRKPKRRC